MIHPTSDFCLLTSDVNRDSPNCVWLGEFPFWKISSTSSIGLFIFNQYVPISSVCVSSVRCINVVFIKCLYWPLLLPEKQICMGTSKKKKFLKYQFFNSFISWNILWPKYLWLVPFWIWWSILEHPKDRLTSYTLRIWMVFLLGYWSQFHLAPPRHFFLQLC